MSVGAKEIKRSAETVRKAIYEKLNEKAQAAIADRATASSQLEIDKANAHLIAMSSLFTAFAALYREYKDEILRKKTFHEKRQITFSAKVNDLIVKLGDVALGFREKELKKIIKEMEEYKAAALLGIDSGHDIELFRMNQESARKIVSSIDTTLAASGIKKTAKVEDTVPVGPLPGEETRPSAPLPKETKHKIEGKKTEEKGEKEKTIASTSGVGEGVLSEAELELQLMAEHKALREAAIKALAKRGASKQDISEAQDFGRKLLDWINYRTNAIDRLLKEAERSVVNTHRIGKELSKMVIDAASYRGQAATEVEQIQNSAKEIETHTLKIERYRAMIAAIRTHIEGEADLFKGKNTPFSYDDIDLLLMIDQESERAYMDGNRALVNIDAELELISNLSQTTRRSYQEAETKYFIEQKRRLDEKATELKDIRARADWLVLNADKLEREIKLKMDAATERFRGVIPAQKALSEMQQQANAVSFHTGVVKEAVKKVNQDLHHCIQALQAAEMAVGIKNNILFNKEYQKAIQALSIAKQDIVKAKRELDKASAANTVFMAAHAAAEEAPINDVKEKALAHANAAVLAQNKVEDMVTELRRLAEGTVKAATDVLRFRSPATQYKIEDVQQKTREIQDFLRDAEMAFVRVKRECNKTKQAVEDVNVAARHKDLNRIKDYFELSSRGLEEAEGHKSMVERVLRSAKETFAILDLAYGEARVDYLADIKSAMNAEEEIIHDAASSVIQASDECRQWCMDAKKMAESAHGVFALGAFKTVEVEQHVQTALQEALRADKLMAAVQSWLLKMNAAGEKALEERPKVQAASLNVDLKSLEESAGVIHSSSTIAIEAKNQAEALREEARTAKEAVIAARDRASVAYMNEVKRRIEEEAAAVKLAADTAEKYRQEMNGYDAGFRDIVGRSVTNYFLPPAAPHVQRLRQHLQGMDQLVDNALPNFVASEKAREEARQAILNATTAATAGDLITLEEQYQIAHEARLAAESARDAGQLQRDELIRRYTAGQPLIMDAHQAHAFEEIRLRRVGEAARLEAIRREQAQQAEIARQQLQTAAEQSKRRQEAAVHDMLVRRGLRNP